MTTKREQVYLGDSVYVEYNGFHFILTTNNGYGATNTIYIEPEVLSALNDYVARLQSNEMP